MKSVRNLPLTLESYYFTVIIFSKKTKLKKIQHTKKGGHLYSDSGFRFCHFKLKYFRKKSIFKSFSVIKVSLNESYYIQ